MYKVQNYYSILSHVALLKKFFDLLLFIVSFTLTNNNAPTALSMTIGKCNVLSSTDITVSVFCLTWYSNSRDIWYFTCWSEHMKNSNKRLLKETIKNCSFCRELDLIHRDETITTVTTIKTFITAPIPFSSMCFN